MNTLSRNSPIALVVGAAGFLGSNIVDKLLSSGIQVVGIDDLSTGRKENLEEAVKDRHFHLLIADISQKIEETFPRLDYAFFLISENHGEYNFNQSFENFLEICKHFSPKIVLASSLELYDIHGKKFSHLKRAETELAEFAAINKVNARIVRLGYIYGPRMTFSAVEPMSRLIKAAVLDELQKESTPLDFTTRDLYISDTVDLLVKAVMHGATAQKIYDGALSNPIKISEIKQLLLDPMWYESRGFIPTELPPWLTPNLKKTEKELSWVPKIPLVTGLKHTVTYFKERPALLNEETKTEKTQVAEKKEDVLVEVENKEPVVAEKPKSLKKTKDWKKFGRGVKKTVIGVVALGIVTYALIYPIASFALGYLTFNQHLLEGKQLLYKDDLSKTPLEIASLKTSSLGIGEVEGLLNLGEKLGLGRFILSEGKILQGSTQIVESLISGNDGFKGLRSGMKVISGEEEGNVKDLFEQAYFKLDKAERGLTETSISISESEQENSFVKFLEQNFQGWFSGGEKETLRQILSSYIQKISQAREVALFLPQIIALEDQKHYLILLMDNTSLRPGGGKILAYGDITFDHGKVAGIKTGKISDLDSLLKEQVSPPSELASIIKGKNWTLKDANFNTDFSDNARLLQWFYTKETGVKTSGIIALDLTTISQLVNSLGSISLDEDGEISLGSDVLTKVTTSTEKEKIMAKILKGTLDKMVYVPSQNFLSSAGVIEEMASQKHLLFYFSIPQLFAKTISSEWAGVFPRQQRLIKGEKEDFLSLVETDLDNSRGGDLVKRSIELKSQIGDDKKVSHELTINLENQGGEYSGQFKVYIASGTKLKGVTLDGADFSKKMNTFVDFGRVGYLIPLTLEAGDKKNLVVNYEDLNLVEFMDDQVKYNVQVVKQPGVVNDKFKFTLLLPYNLKFIPEESSATPREKSFTTDLSSDRKFNLTITKS